MMTTMKAALAIGGAGIDAITIVHMPVPVPQPGEALVRFKAAALNYRDLMGVHGPLAVKQPSYVPLSCGVGEVVAVADDVTRVRIGDRVNSLFSQGWLTGPKPNMAMLGGPVDGVARHYGAFDAESLCLVPDAIGDLEAATLPCAGLTAWSALFGARPLQPGEWILVQGTGGVAVAATQWAKALGAHVIVTSSSDAKLRRATALGADAVINYRTDPNWADAAREITGGRGIDIVVDVVGGSQAEACARAAAEGGAISAIGQIGGKHSWGLEVGVPIVPIAVGNREGHEAMLAFCAQHSVRPVVDAVYELDRLGDALRHTESGDFFGKVAISLL